MAENDSPKRMTRRREKAALLVAEDKVTDHEIALQCKIGDRTVFRWKKEPSFAARVTEHRERWAAEIEAEGIANRKNRVDMLNRDWQRLEQVAMERAADPEMADIPGGTTGLLVHTVRVVGVGQNAQRVDEYAVDTGLLKEKREHAKQAAIELKQWTEQKDVTSGNEPLRFTIAIDRGDSPVE